MNRRLPQTPGAWQKIVSAYTPEKRAWDRIYPWLYFVARPISFLITWPLAAAGATANQVTFVTLLLGIALCAAFAQGAVLTGAVLLAALNLFDCVDGNLARMKPSGGPPAGKFYDQLVGLTWYGSYFFMGWGLSRGADRSEALVFLAAGAAASLFKLAGLQVRSIFWSVLGPAWNDNARGAGVSAGSSIGKGWLRRLYYNVTDLQGQDPIVLAAAATGRMDVFVLATAVIQAADVTFLVAFFVCRSETLRRKYAEKRS